MKAAANGFDERTASGPSSRLADGWRGSSAESKKPVAIGHGVAGSPGDKSQAPYSSGAAITPGPSSIPFGRVARSKARSCVRHLPLRQEGEAICIGLSEALGLRGVPPSSAAVFGVGFRLHGQKKTGMIEGVRVLPERGVASNKGYLDSSVKEIVSP